MLDRREMEEIIQLCKNNRVLIERSLKYENPKDFLRLAEKMEAKTVVGSDAHSIWEIRKLA
jgi:histidinol phosphatase-like PHP family hydrolase